MEQQTPIPPPQIKDEAARRAKTRHFPILDLGGGGVGRGGLGFPFILSKIVASWRGELEDLGLSERVRRVKKVKIVSRSQRRIKTKM